MSKKKDYMTVREVADYLGYAPTTIHKWINAGQIDAHRRGLMPKSPLVVRRDEVERIKRILEGRDA